MHSEQGTPDRPEAPAEAESTEYASRDAYWLLVLAEAMDPAQEQEIRIDGLNISAQVFERIIVYNPLFGHIVEGDPAYEWASGDPLW